MKPAHNIHEVTGDILLSKAAVIAHGVAPNDDFHAGLALQLRERFPAMYKDFRHYCQTHHPKSGDMWVWSGSGPSGPVRIACLLTQEAAYDHGKHPGRATHESVNHALKKLRSLIDADKPGSVALPKLATGVGGLKWDEVAPLIHKHLGNIEMPVWLYTNFQKGQAANETLLNAHH
ncbi:MAG: macro domain-containing protein [Phycisphaerales bacterium]|nr:macro domain-containing protein [Phycisphaerales bacterium]